MYYTRAVFGHMLYGFFGFENLSGAQKWVERKLNENASYSEKS